MPRRDDIHKILLIGSGPIVIGQAAEFDYSGTQACRVLMEEGYEVVLVNSNPATIMTDPEVATTTYIEPLLPGPVAQVIEREQPDALLPTLGGQTALNLAKALHEDGTLERYGVELIGADYDAIDRAEDRERFRETMTEAGPARAAQRDRAHASTTRARRSPRSACRSSCARRSRSAAPAAASCATEADLERVVGRGLTASPIGQVLLEESVLGWGEFELEVMRDRADNVVIVCSIENLDPMGVHTGDSVCVAPQQTLTDKQYQALRDQAIAVIRAVGVETGGSNVQFAVNPRDRRDRRDRDEPARVALERAGEQGDRLPDRQDRRAARGRLHAAGDPQRHHPGDAGELRAGDRLLRRQVAAVRVREVPRRRGRPDHAHEVGRRGDGDRAHVQAGVRQGAALARARRHSRASPDDDDDAARAASRSPGAERFDHLLEALRRGVAIEELHAAHEHRPLVPARAAASSPPTRRPPFAGERTFKSVDTCAAEFAARTPYYYSGWERAGTRTARRHEVRRGERPSVVILGSGPNRIGQGIEFDYCCVHAAQTVRESGRDAVMINCNPETVSTDYDTSDRLYFEPLTLEDVLGVCEIEQPEGVVVQFGGQTPLKLAAGLHEAGVPILGTSIDAIDLAEDRSRFGPLLDRLGYKAPAVRAPRAPRRRRSRSRPSVGFPLLVRPSYVLGGRAMEIVYSVAGLQDYLDRVRPRGRRDDLPRPLPRGLDRGRRRRALRRRRTSGSPGSCSTSRRPGSTPATRPACCRRTRSATRCSAQIREQTDGIARALGVVGLLNVQFAIHGEEGLHVIEANPRASRTVPFVSKAIGLPLAKLACRIMLGERIADLELPEDTTNGHVCVKEVVLPFNRFAGADALLGPGDALDRRGDGDRARLPDRVREGPGRGRGEAAELGHGVHHRRRRRQAGGDRDRHAAARPRLPRSSPPAARPRRCARWGSRPRRSTRSARARRTSSTGSSAARSTS